MANTPSSIEMQIDNFLEHFKRSASKAMDNDWKSTESTSNYGHTTASTIATTAASFNHSSPLKTTRTRSSCFDISQLGSISGTTHSISITLFLLLCLFLCLLQLKWIKWNSNKQFHTQPQFK